VSQYFLVGGRIVWNPSNRVAELFVQLAGVMAEAAATPSGLHDTGADEYEVDLVLFEAFTDALTRRYLSSSHVIMRSLIEGFLATALVLVDRAGGTVSALSEVVALDARDLAVGTLGVSPQGDATRLRDLAAVHAQEMVV
jgi:hypothetical protein